MAINPIVGGALVQVAGNFLDKMFGGDHAEDSATDQANLNYERQKEFAQSGIQWRVKDAQAAGVHPLYAIGGGGAAFSPNPITIGGSDGSFDQMGQSLSRAALAGMSDDDKSLHSAQLRLIESQIDKTTAEAAALRSQAVRDEQANFNQVYKPEDVFVNAMHSSGGMDIHPSQIRELPPVSVSPSGPKFDAIKYKPNEIVSSRRDEPPVTPGQKPLFDEYNTRWGRIRLPQASNAGEAMEDMTPFDAKTWLTMAENFANYYGPGWRGFKDRIGRVVDRYPSRVLGLRAWLKK